MMLLELEPRGVLRFDRRGEGEEGSEQKSSPFDPELAATERCWLAQKRHYANGIFTREEVRWSTISIGIVSYCSF